MASRTEVEELLSNFGKAYGLSDLTLDEQGDAAIVVNEGATVVLHYDEPSGQIVLESQVGQLSEEDRHDELEQLMRGNFMGTSTMGGVIALGPDDVIVMQRVIPQRQIDQATFGLAVRAHVAAVESWTEHMDRDLGAGAEDDEDDIETSGEASAAPVFDPSKLV